MDRHRNGAIDMSTTKSSHKNTTRLTAIERVRRFNKIYNVMTSAQEFEAERMLQAHAREAVARYKRKHAIAWDRMLAKGAGK